MSDMMNAKLLQFYKTALDKLFKSWVPEPEDSRPMLISVPPGYSTSRVKLMVVGQEAGGWAETVPIRPNSARDLMHAYQDFSLGRHQHSTPFWQGARHVNEKMNPGVDTESFLWSNLVKVDVRRVRPPPEVEEALTSLGLLQAELTITMPAAVIFFTGPRYDDRMRKTFSGIEFEDLGGGTAKITGLPFNAVRTYHPRYLRMSGRWGELDKAVEVLVGAD